jgi:hypothetical protein
VGYLEDPARTISEEKAGRERFANQFEESLYKSKVASIIPELCEAGTV